MTTTISITTIIVILVMCALGIAPANIQHQVSDVFQAARWVDMDKVITSDHPIERRGEKVTTDARSLIKGCAPENQRVYRGIGKYQGFWLFACILASGKVALIVVVPAIIEGTPMYREVTDFISRSTQYLSHLIETARYVPIQ
jgi:hypothetical protein